MITIAQRAIMFRCSAKLCKSNRVRDMYNETADVLEAQAAAYSDLYAAAESAIQEGDLTALRAHMRKIAAKEKEMQERSGAV